MIKLSVIIPIYNVKQYISRCLESVISCGIPDSEIILVDDGSTDCSLQTIRSYAQKYDSIKVIEKANGGVSSARNEGLNVAIGEWIWFIDADDYLLDGADVVIKDCLAKEHDMVALSYIWEASQSKRYSIISNEGISKDVCNGKSYLHSVQMSATVWSYLFRRKIIARYGLRMSENLKFGEDRVFVMEYLAHSSTVFLSPIPVYDYSFSPQSAVHQNFMKNRRELEDQVGSIGILLENINRRKESIGIYKYQIMFLISVYLIYLKNSSFEIDDFQVLLSKRKSQWKKMGYSSLLLNMISFFFPVFVSHPYFVSIRILSFYRRWQVLRNHVSAL